MPQKFRLSKNDNVDNFSVWAFGENLCSNLLSRKFQETIFNFHFQHYCGIPGRTNLMAHPKNHTTPNSQHHQDLFITTHQRWLRNVM